MSLKSRAYVTRSQNCGPTRENSNVLYFFLTNRTKWKYPQLEMNKDYYLVFFMLKQTRGVSSNTI